MIFLYATLTESQLFCSTIVTTKAKQNITISHTVYCYNCRSTIFTYKTDALRFPQLLQALMESREPFRNPLMASGESPLPLPVEHHHSQSLQLTSPLPSRSAVARAMTLKSPATSLPQHNQHVSTDHTLDLSSSRKTTSSVRHVLAAVRVQRGMVDGSVHFESTDVDAWTSTQLVRCYVHPVTSEERVSVRFTDGTSADVVSGAVLFPHEHTLDQQVSKIHTMYLTTSHTSEQFQAPNIDEQTQEGGIEEDFLTCRPSSRDMQQ